MYMHAYTRVYDEKKLEKTRYQKMFWFTQKDVLLVQLEF